MPDNPVTNRQRSWQMWLLARSRPLAFAIAMLVFLVFVLVFGPTK